eukprot:3957043-Amphidinium_carterae.1
MCCSFRQPSSQTVRVRYGVNEKKLSYLCSYPSFFNDNELKKAMTATTKRDESIATVGASNDLWSNNSDCTCHMGVAKPQLESGEHSEAAY